VSGHIRVEYGAQEHVIERVVLTEAVDEEHRPDTASIDEQLLPVWPDRALSNRHDATVWSRTGYRTVTYHSHATRLAACPERAVMEDAAEAACDGDRKTHHCPFWSGRTVTGW